MLHKRVAGGPYFLICRHSYTRFRAAFSCPHLAPGGGADVEGRIVSGIDRPLRAAASRSEGLRARWATPFVVWWRMVFRIENTALLPYP